MVCRAAGLRLHSPAEHSNNRVNHRSSLRRDYSSKGLHSEHKKTPPAYHQWANATLPLSHQPEYQALDLDLRRLAHKNLPPIPPSLVQPVKLVPATKRNMAKVEAKQALEIKPESIKEIRKEVEDLKTLIEHRDQEINRKIQQLFQKLNAI